VGQVTMNHNFLLAPVDCCSDLMNSTKWRCSRSCEGWMKISWSLKTWV